jgi:hypothetical protein
LAAPSWAPVQNHAGAEIKQVFVPATHQHASEKSLRGQQVKVVAK